MPPLDSASAAPHVDAGLVQLPDGSWGFPETAQPPPHQTVDLAGNPVNLPDNLPAVNLPQVAPAQTPAPQEAVIDVGGARPVSAAHAAVAPHVAAGLVQAPDGSWGFQDIPQQPAATNAPSEPPSPTPSPSTPPATSEPPAPPGAIPKSVENQELRAQPWYQHLTDTIEGIQGSIGHGLSFGMNEIVAPIPNAIASSIKKGIPFSQAYDEEVAKQRQQRLNFEGQHPALGTALEVAAGIPGAMAMGPLFDAAPAAGQGAAYLGNLAIKSARNLAAGAGTGAATSFTSADGDISQRLEAAKQGAVVGAASVPVGAVAGEALKTAIAPIHAGIQSLSPRANADRAVGNILTEQNTGLPLVTNPSPIPGMPLNVAQAGNPALAPLVDRLGNSAEGMAARKAEESAQNQAMLGHLPGNFRGGGAPEPQAGAASARAAQNIREASEVIGGRERQLWNVPILTQPNITTESMKAEVNAWVRQLRAGRPGLGDAYDRSELPGIVSDLNARPDRDAASELNSLSSRARKIARSPNTPDPVRLVAGELATAIQDAFSNTREVAGRPAIPAHTRIPVYPEPGWSHYDANGNLRPLFNPNDPTRPGRYPPALVRVPEVPAVPPNPALVNALQTARDFTRREATVLGHADFDAILKRNNAGNYVNAEENGLNKFFNFNQGNMQPGEIRDVLGFLDDIGAEMRRLGNQSVVGGFNANDVAAVRNRLATNTRDFLIAKMLSAVQMDTLDRAGDQIIGNAKISGWIRRNAGMLRDTGVFTQGQLDALDRVRQAAEMIQQGQSQGKAIGSDTFSRLSGTRFMDAFLPPGATTRATLVIGSSLGGITGALTGIPFGAALGGLAAAGTERSGVGLVRLLYGPSQRIANERLAQVIRDPILARELSLRATPQNANLLSPYTRQFLRSLLATAPVDQGERIQSDDKIRAQQQAQPQVAGPGQAGPPPFPPAPAQAPPPDHRTDGGNPWAGDDPFARATPTLADAWQKNTRLLQDWSEAEKQDGIRKGLIDPQTGWPTKRAIIDAVHQYGSALLGSTEGPGIRAFHGTPHSFDKFDIGKIGSGEGAQVYGHGLYFAEREGIAKDYRERLSKSNHNPDYSVALDRYHHALAEVHKLHDQMVQESLSLGAKLDPGWGEIGVKPLPEVIAKHQTRWDELTATADGAKETLDHTSPYIDNPGHMYEVKINADPAHMLHWDKKLSEQTPEVQQKLRDLGVKMPSDLYKVRPVEGGWVVDNAKQSGSTYINGTWQISSKESGKPRVFRTQEAAQQAADATAEMAGHNPTGEALYQKLGYGALKEGGIPGVSYLDAASRGGFQNARNLARNTDALAQANKQLAEVQEEITRNRDNPGLLPRFFERREQEILEYKDRIKALEKERDDLLEAQKTTHNHVVFDDATIEIIRKYGIAGLMAMGTAAAATHRQEQ
jgi:hypothetical protein